MKHFMLIPVLWLGGLSLAADSASMSFVDVTESVGITFKHYHGAFGKKYMPETMGAGGAFLDFNQDGWQDLLLVNGRDWPGQKSSGPHTPALYQNLGNGRFCDVTGPAGLSREMYGMGCCIADYDNDGFDDLYLANLGEDVLFKNNGDGTFTDVTDEAGVGLAGWSTGCLWLDVDNDGFLDLFVGHYVAWDIDRDLWCTLDGVNKSYCTPESYPGVSPCLFRNQGDGTFADVTQKAGVYNPNAKTLGCVAFDFNQDGWLDIAVANDTQPDYLYQNRGDGTFMEVGMMSGMAFDETGRARAGMGMDVTDYDHQGRFSLIVGNFTNEMIGVFHNEGNGLFLDSAARTRVGSVSLPYLTFGLCCFDADLDGHEDLLAVNGHVEDQIAVVQKHVTYAQRPLLFRNQGNGRFTEIGKTLGDSFAQPLVGRGAAYADIDNDGDLDVLITANHDRPRLFRNDGSTHHWIRFKLQGTQSNRNGVGTHIKVFSGDHVQHRVLKAGHSYCSQSELILTFGLGALTAADRVEVLWPRGQQEILHPVIGGKTYLLVEGQGIKASL